MKKSKTLYKQAEKQKYGHLYFEIDTSKPSKMLHKAHAHEDGFLDTSINVAPWLYDGYDKIVRCF